MKLYSYNPDTDWYDVIDVTEKDDKKYCKKTYMHYYYAKTNIPTVKQK